MTHLKRLALLGGSAAVLAWSAGGAHAQEQVELTMLTSNNANATSIAEALTQAYTEQNPNVTFELETRPGGSEGDNIVKTRLATQQMSDVFAYNSGSLLQALNPTQTLVDLSDQPFMDRIEDSFKQVVSVGDGVFGVPMSAADAGGIFYNREIYDELDLEVPMTWDEFMANNEKIDEAGYAPVIQTYGETWTSQLLLLADYYNLQAEVPDFAEKYTANEAKFATTPAALRGFERLEAIHDAGYMNEDFGAATYSDGLRMLVEGEGAHYPMLTFAIPAISDTYPDQIDKIGFFAQPGESADTNGLTVWMPTTYYVPQTTTGAKREAALDFLSFVASPEGCAAQAEAVTINGPFLVEGCELPSDVPPVVEDLLPYFGEGGNNAPALEFVSPVKGPQLEQLTVEVGSGIRSPKEAAELYDKDVERQAQQLGLEGW